MLYGGESLVFVEASFPRLVSRLSSDHILLVDYDRPKGRFFIIICDFLDRLEGDKD